MNYDIEGITLDHPAKYSDVELGRVIKWAYRIKQDAPKLADWLDGYAVGELNRRSDTDWEPRTLNLAPLQWSNEDIGRGVHEIMKILAATRKDDDRVGKLLETVAVALSIFARERLLGD